MKKQNMNVKNLKSIKLFAFLLAFFLISNVSVNYVAAQCKPMIKIDGKATVVDEYDNFGLKLPVWLKAGQTLAVGSSVSFISILEFTENSTSNTLEYSKVVIVDGSTTLQDGTVPVGKVWKLESIIKENNSSTYKSVTFNSRGTYIWKVPGCAEEICIDMWSGGGGGGGGSSIYQSSNWYYAIGGGGGGGGYGSQCFNVQPGDEYTIIVGAGGKGGNGCSNSSGCSGGNGTNGGQTSINGPGIFINVTGGIRGTGGVNSTGGTGGAGGTSTVFSNAQGASGINGCTSSSGPCGDGGAGANGGAGGIGVSSGAGNNGSLSGGGGSGSYANNTAGSGADGKVIISW